MNGKDDTLNAKYDAFVSLVCFIRLRRI